MAEHDLEGRRVLVTGGHGFIGQHVVRELAARGAIPIAVVHPGGRLIDDLPAESLRVDLQKPGAIEPAMAGVDFVVHLAARAGGIQFQENGAEEVFSVNRSITDNLLRASAANGVKRMFLASSLVTYRQSDEPLGENHPQLLPADQPNPYAWSKITDEVVAHWYELETVVGRFGNVFGPGASFDPEHSTVVHALVDRAAGLADDEPLVIWGDGSAVRSFVFVGDAAKAVALVLSKGEGGEAYNIDTGHPVTVADLADTVRQAVNPSLQLAFDETKPAGVPFRVASIEKLTGLGYSPDTSLREGIAETVAWYRSS